MVSGSCSSCRGRSPTNTISATSPLIIASSWSGSPRSVTVPSSCRSSFHHRSDPATSTRWRRSCSSLPTSHRYAVELRHHAFYDDPQLEAHVEQFLGDHDVEWISLDTTTLYADVPPSAAERGARRQKPHLPRRLRALTDHPVVRFVGTDDPDQTRAGWQPWLPVLAGWLAEGRSPTVFVHTPTTSPHHHSPATCTTTSAATCRHCHRSPNRSVPSPVEEPTLFADETDDTVSVPTHSRRCGETWTLRPPVEVMLARAVDAVPAAYALPGGVQYEQKWDGYRLVGVQRTPAVPAVTPWRRPHRRVPRGRRRRGHVAATSSSTASW